jgi:hypothetical protein
VIRGLRTRCDLGRDGPDRGTDGLSYCEVVSGFDEITRHDDADSDDDVWVGGQPEPTPILVVESDPTWPHQFVHQWARAAQPGRMDV